jgi:RNA polymerase sigma-70 factor (ECF subfamily)
MHGCFAPGRVVALRMALWFCGMWERRRNICAELWNFRIWGVMSFRGSSYEAMADDEVVALFKQSGDHAAFKALYERHAREIYRHCYAFSKGRSAEAEDQQQETFLRAYRRMDQYEGGNFIAWLKSIAKNVCLDRIRREKPVMSLEREEGEAPIPVVDHRPTQDEQQQVNELYEQIEQLPADQANCLRLFLGGSSYEEIAGELQLSVKSVKSHLQNGKRTLTLRMGKKTA